MCVRGVDDWIGRQSRKQIGMIIMDETKESGLKNVLRTSFRSLRGRLRVNDISQLQNIHDDMYFGDSQDSVGIQITDLCSYFVLRKLNGNDDEFFRIFSRHAICSKIEPDWTQLQGVLLEC